jgi:hypothetical protein
LSGEPTLELLLEVQAHFGLPSPALVEKDFYVVRALAAIAAIDTEPLHLIFGGGTELSRAHRLIRRMSEDIDLRIVAVAGSPSRGLLRRLREQVTGALLGAGFEFNPKDPAHRGNESRYSVVEMAADKLIALTRRVGAELTDLAEPDPTLMRHLHDLRTLRSQYEPAEVAAHAREIMLSDAEAHGNQFPAYREAPLRETMSEGGSGEGRSGMTAHIPDGVSTMFAANSCPQLCRYIERRTISRREFSYGIAFIV